MWVYLYFWAKQIAEFTLQILYLLYIINEQLFSRLTDIFYIYLYFKKKNFYLHNFFSLFYFCFRSLKGVDIF